MNLVRVVLLTSGLIWTETIYLYGGMVMLGLRLFALCHKNVQNMEPVQNCMCSIVCAFSKQQLNA